MPMEIFVNCVGDLATLGGLVLVVTPVCSPPGSFSFFVCKALGIRSLPWQIPWVPAELSSLRGGEVSRSQQRDARYLNTYSAAA